MVELLVHLPHKVEEQEALELVEMELPVMETKMEELVRLIQGLVAAAELEEGLVLAVLGEME